jgi:hypothetical protein
MLGVRAGRAFDGERVVPGGALVVLDEGRIVGVEPGAARGLHRIAACRDVVRAATCRLKLGPDVACRPRGRPVRRRR